MTEIKQEYPCSECKHIRGDISSLKDWTEGYRKSREIEVSELRKEIGNRLNISMFWKITAATTGLTMFLLSVLIGTTTKLYTSNAVMSQKIDASSRVWENAGRAMQDQVNDLKDTQRELIKYVAEQKLIDRRLLEKLFDYKANVEHEK